jgi:hypothetical protein
MVISINLFLFLKWHLKRLMVDESLLLRRAELISTTLASDFSDLSQ